MKLTNRSISENYGDRKYYLSKKDFLSAFAYWVIQQSPYDTPDIKYALNDFNIFLDVMFGREKYKEYSLNDLNVLITEDVFENLTHIEKLNHPKIDNGKSIMFIDRYSKPNPDYDFIDLGALAHNIKYMIIRECVMG